MLSACSETSASYCQTNWRRGLLLKNSLLAHVLILLWREGISQSQPGSSQIQHSRSHHLHLHWGQQSLPFQTRRVPANLPGISSGGSWQEVNREKETCPEYDCFEFGLSMPLGLGYNKQEHGKNGIFPVLLLHLGGFRI